MIEPLTLTSETGALIIHPAASRHAFEQATIEHTSLDRTVLAFPPTARPSTTAAPQAAGPLPFDVFRFAHSCPDALLSPPLLARLRDDPNTPPYLASMARALLSIAGTANAN